MKSVGLIALFTTSLLVLGCGGSEGPPPAGLVAQAQVQTHFPDLKKRLETIAGSGQKGEGFEMLQQQIDQSVRSSDATLADELLTDYTTLSKSTSATEIKGVAARMAAKL